MVNKHEINSLTSKTDKEEEAAEIAGLDLAF